MPRNFVTIEPFSSIVDCLTMPSGEISVPRSLSKLGAEIGNMKPRETSLVNNFCNTVGWSEADF